MYTKDEFKQRFGKLDNELIENALRPLTEEAMEAIVELLKERGIQGHALERKVSEVRRSVVSHSGVTTHCDYCGKSAVSSP